MGLILSRLTLHTVQVYHYLYKPKMDEQADPLAATEQADPVSGTVDEPILDSITMAEDQQSQEQPTDPAPAPAQEVKRG